MKPAVKFWTTLVVVAFLAKYCVGLYILFQLAFGVGFNPAVWYYYPLLGLLFYSIYKVQDSCFRLSYFYYKMKEHDEPEV